jgi:putative ABC transport system substrate-binding protein
LEVAGFRKQLQQLGWEDGRNAKIEIRWSAGDLARIQAHAKELVALQPDVIFTNTAPATQAVARATRTIPVVVGPSGEATFAEFAVNFARPVGNVTGMTLYSQGQDEKCLELLKEAAPGITRVGILVNPLNPNLRESPTYLRKAADALGLSLVRMEARDADGIDAAFGEAARIDGLHVPDDSNLAGRPRARAKIVELTSAKRIPVASTHLGFAQDGAVIALGTDIPALARRAAVYVDKILKGAKPSDLPVERPSVVRLAVNLKAARDLGLTLPPSLLLRADEVIE